GSVGFTTGASTSSLAALAGVQSVGNALIPTAGTATATGVAEAAAALGAEAVIQAGAQTAIEGGSFLTNLRDDGVADTAAAAAYAIGTAKPDLNEVEYLAAHAALGCAEGAASGQGCGGGAIGGATSAALTPVVASAITGGTETVTAGQSAAVAVFAALAGGAAAGLAGQSVTAGELAAENEAINNCLGHPESCTQLFKSTASSAAEDVESWLASPTGLQVMAELSANADIGGAASEEEGLIESAESAFAADESSVLASAVSAPNSGITTIYRAMGPEEFSSVMSSGQFSFVLGNNEMKQFGFNLNEVLTYANFESDYAAIVSADIPTSVLGNFSFSNTIDPFIFKSGVLSVERKPALSLLNSVVTNIKHAY
ncbi:MULTISPECIES: DUF637 domain-containing protein, partial [unclassified Paraburkholderia]|uniref:DUF637 domain-containing protein n=1 Tax=unclassified Paraburkholderia TaxID=2615204 RepID=UPI002AB22683